MAQPLGKGKLKILLKEIGCETEFDMWQRAQSLDDADAARLDRLADEHEGVPKLRELDAYLLLDAGDGETIVVFRNDRGTRRELLRQLTSGLPKESESREDFDDEPEYADE